MMRIRRGALAFALALAVVPATAAPGLAEAESAPIYLALGDSWAYGQGAADPAATGYVPQLYQALGEGLDCLPAVAEQAADGCKQLQLVSLGRPATAALPGVTAPAVRTSNCRSRSRCSDATTTPTRSTTSR